MTIESLRQCETRARQRGQCIFTCTGVHIEMNSGARVKKLGHGARVRGQGKILRRRLVKLYIALTLATWPSTLYFSLDPMRSIHYITPAMLPTIDVRQTSDDDPMAFHVTVKEGNRATQHHVTMTRATYLTLTGGDAPPARCIEAAFRFLLDHEPKESILGRFDVTVIGTYFHSFERELNDYLSR